MAVTALRHHKPRHIAGKQLRQHSLDRIGQLAQEQARESCAQEQ